MMASKDLQSEEDKVPQSTEMELGVKYILEAGVKANCNFQLMTGALVIYHTFMRNVKKVQYDQAMVAAAALRLSSKVEEAELDIDGLVFLFYHMVNKTVENLYPGSMKFEVLKKSFITVEFIIQRMLNFHLKFNIAHQYLVPFLSVLEHRARDIDSFLTVMGATCMRYINDFYTNRMCVQYRPEDICIACIDTALKFHGFEKHLEMLDPWYEGFSIDLTEERVDEMSRNLLRLYKPHFTKKPPVDTEEVFSLPEDSSPEK